jgi:kinetochore protein Nuf2
VERLKQERFALSQEHRSRAEELHGLEQAVSDAQLKLMRSPDRVRRGIAEKERQLAESRALKSELDGHLRAGEMRLRVFNEINEGVKALNHVQNEIIAFRDQADEKRRQNSERKEQNRALENELHQCERESASLETKLQDMKTRFDKLAEDRMRARERFEARERELSSQRAALQAERMAESEEAARLEREAHEYEVKTAEFVRERERHQTELVKEWKMLEAHMSECSCRSC